MKPISQVTALVFDNGLFQPIAHRLAKDCKRVLYHVPWEKGFSTLNDHIRGDGFADIEMCESPWDVKDEVDLWVFPDIGHSGIQLELERQGKAVWGSRKADSIELNRQKFNRILKEVGLPVATHEVIKGLTNLRAFLKDKEDRFIKFSKFRGTMETTHWRSYDMDEGWLDKMAVKLGPAKDMLPFLVFEPIDTGIEIGGDTYCVDGKWPSLMLHGLENKDKCYLGAVTPIAEMPEDLRNVMEAFRPLLSEYRYRNQFSMEDRDGFLIDPTMRGGLPSTGSQLETWTNFPDIVWHGANGELVDPIPAYKFSVEAIITIKSDRDEWGKTRIPDGLGDAVKLTGCCEIEGAICFPPCEGDGKEVGWLVAGGDSIEDAIDNIKEFAEKLPVGLEAATDELVGLIKSAHEGEKENWEFSRQEIPSPEIVVK